MHDAKRNAVMDFRPARLRWVAPAAAGLLMAAALLTSGCTGPKEWIANGFKVGPNYGRPPAPVADNWIEVEDSAVRTETTDYSAWWTVFHDPVLDELIQSAYRQNLTLKIAGMRILEARAQRGIAAGNLFPQSQVAKGHYARSQWSKNAFPFGMFPIQKSFDDWQVGFDATWELDIWGRIRRGIESADANLNAQVEGYDNVLVMVQAETAAAYLQMRTVQERLKLARDNVTLQKRTLKIAQDRFDQGVVSELDVRQARAAVATTESLIPVLEEAQRKAENGICILLGLPPQQLPMLSQGPQTIPAAPSEVVVGIPAELLRRRPDVREAERQAAAQCAQIGIAESDFYPHFAITGNIGFNAEDFSRLFQGSSIAGAVGPAFSWKILNYGRIRNNVLMQDARFQQAVLNYQNTVLKANKEVEDAIVSFLRERVREQSLKESATQSSKATELALIQYEQGIIDYQRVLDTQRAMLLQQDALAESQGKVTLNLVAVYKAVGGGWQMRCRSGAPDLLSGEPVVAPTIPEPASDTGLPEVPMVPPATLPVPAPPKPEAPKTDAAPKADETPKAAKQIAPELKAGPLADDPVAPPIEDVKK